MEFRAIAPPDTLSKMACLQAKILEGASLPTPMYVQTQELPAVYSSRCLYISCNDCRSTCVCPECRYGFAFALQLHKQGSSVCLQAVTSAETKICGHQHFQQ